MSSTRSFTVRLRSRNCAPTSPAIAAIFFIVRVSTRTPSPSRLDVGRIMDVGLHHRGVDAHPLAGRDALFQRYRHQPLVNPLDHLRPDCQAPAAHRLGVRHLLPADPSEVAIDQVGAHFAFENLVAPVAHMLEHQKAEDHLGRCTMPTAAATLWMSPCQRFVNRRHHSLVIKQPIGMLHPELAQIFDFLGNQSVAEAALGPPHLNHDAYSPIAPSFPPAREQFVIEFADRFDGLFQLLIVGQPLAHHRHHLATQAELTRAPARVAHRQYRQPVTFAARAFGTAAGVVADGSLEQRSAQNLAGHRQSREQLLAHRDQLFSSHSYK